MAQDHQKNRLEGIRCNKKIKLGNKKGKICGSLLLTQDGSMCDRCKQIHSPTEILDMLFRAGLSPKEALKHPALNEELQKSKVKKNLVDAIEICHAVNQFEANSLIKEGWRLMKVYKTSYVLAKFK